MIRVEGFWYSLDQPAFIFFAPDGSSQRECRLGSRRPTQTQPIPGNTAAIIVEHNRQPRLDRSPSVVEHKEMQSTVVRLPQLIGPRGFPAIEQIMLLAIAGCPLMGQRHERCWQ